MEPIGRKSVFKDYCFKAEKTVVGEVYVDTFVFQNYSIAHMMTDDGQTLGHCNVRHNLAKILEHICFTY